MLRVGLIGNGEIAKSHNKAYARIQSEGDLLAFSACCDIRPEQLQNLGDTRTYTDIDDMLNQEQGRLDYVDICLPTYLHSETTVKALKAGYNVLCEKPMARNMEQAKLMIRTAQETDKLLMIAHCNRFMDSVGILRSICLGGELGSVRSAEFYREGGSTGSMGYNNWFRDGTLSGGAMLDLHIHDVDLIRWIFGMPLSVNAAATKVIPGSGYDAMSVNYICEGGVFVHASCDWTIKHDKFNTRSIRINFAKGYVFCDRTAGRQTFVKVTDNGTVTDLSEYLNSDFFYNEIMYYANCLFNKSPVDECPLEQSADALQVVMAEIQSADKSGEKVILQEDRRSC